MVLARSFDDTVCKIGKTRRYIELRLEGSRILACRRILSAYITRGLRTVIGWGDRLRVLACGNNEKFPARTRRELKSPMNYVGRFCNGTS